MEMTRDALDGGAWASQQDCTYQLASITQYLAHDATALNRAILAATGIAQSYLRPRWRDAWPFTTVPAELRDAVASIAVYGAVRAYGMELAAKELMEQLRLEAKRAEAWLRDVAAGTADLNVGRPTDGTTYDQAHVAKLPGGEFGFN